MNELQNIISNFPQKVITANGLTDLPAMRRRKLRLLLQSMLIQKVLNELLMHLDEARFQALMTEIGQSENEEETFRKLIQSVPQAQEIITEETEILFENLSK